jgi:hypothetical protein
VIGAITIPITGFVIAPAWRLLKNSMRWRAA